MVNRDLFRYEIHSLVKAFYPADEVKVLVEGDDHGGRILAENPFIFARVTYEDDTIVLTVCVSAGENNKAAGGNSAGIDAGAAVAAPSREGEREAAEDTEGSAADQVVVRVPLQGADRHGARDLLKKSLYEALCQTTGRTLPWGDLIGIRPTKLCSGILEKGGTQQDAARFLVTEHKVSTEKAVLAADIAAREARILAPIHYQDGYSLYIGIPFCPTTCLYCSFPSFNLSAWRDRVDDYLTALIREMAAAAELMQGQITDTIYIGGGTPTTLEPAQLERLLKAIEQYYDTSRLLEFTVEAGRPDSITREKLAVLKAHGVTRISVNPQTMNDETLRLIGRHHTVQQTIEAYELARACGFDNINMDIILGLPGEGLPEVAHTIAAIRELNPDDLTVHSLAIKRSSRLRQVLDARAAAAEKNKKAAGQPDSGPESAAAPGTDYAVLRNTDETMHLAAEGAAAMGMKPYYLYRQKNMSGNFENTGYARDGKYGIYNILIMEEKQSILALGAGSISKIVVRNPEDPAEVRIERADHPKDVATYIDNIDEMIQRERKLFGF